MRKHEKILLFQIINLYVCSLFLQWLSLSSNIFLNNINIGDKHVKKNFLQTTSTEYQTMLIKLAWKIIRSF